MFTVFMFKAVILIALLTTYNIQGIFGLMTNNEIYQSNNIKGGYTQLLTYPRQHRKSSNQNVLPQLKIHLTSKYYRNHFSRIFIVEVGDLSSLYLSITIRSTQSLLSDPSSLLNMFTDFFMHASKISYFFHFI